MVDGEITTLVSRWGGCVLRTIAIIVFVVNDIITTNVGGNELLIGTHRHEFRSDAKSVGIGAVIGEAVGGSDDAG